MIICETIAWAQPCYEARRTDRNMPLVHSLAETERTVEIYELEACYGKVTQLPRTRILLAVLDVSNQVPDRA